MYCAFGLKYHEPLRQDGGDGGYGGGGFSETPTDLNYNGLPSVSDTAGSTTVSNNGFDPSTGQAVVAPPSSLDLNAGIGTIGSGDSNTSQGTATSVDATGGTTNTVFSVGLLPDNSTIPTVSPAPVLQTPPDSGGNIPWADVGKGVTTAASVASAIAGILGSTGGSSGKVQSPGVAGNASRSSGPVINTSGVRAPTGSKSSGAGLGTNVVNGVKGLLDSITGGGATKATQAVQGVQQTDTILVLGIAAVLALLLFRK